MRRLRAITNSSSIICFFLKGKTMNNTDIIRAWKDEAFRESLGETMLLEHPAGQIELTDESLSGVQAAYGAQMIAVTRMNTGTNCLSDICGFCSGYCP